MYLHTLTLPIRGRLSISLSRPSVSPGNTNDLTKITEGMLVLKAATIGGLLLLAAIIEPPLFLISIVRERSTS